MPVGGTDRDIHGLRESTLSHVIFLPTFIGLSANHGIRAFDIRIYIEIFQNLRIIHITSAPEGSRVEIFHVNGLLISD